MADRDRSTDRGTEIDSGSDNGIDTERDSTTKTKQVTDADRDRYVDLDKEI